MKIKENFRPSDAQSRIKQNAEIKNNLATQEYLPYIDKQDSVIRETNSEISS